MKYNMSKMVAKLATINNDESELKKRVKYAKTLNILNFKDSITPNELKNIDQDVLDEIYNDLEETQFNDPPQRLNNYIQSINCQLNLKYIKSTETCQTEDFF